MLLSVPSRLHMAQFDHLKRLLHAIPASEPAAPSMSAMVFPSQPSASSAYDPSDCASAATFTNAGDAARLEKELMKQAELGPAARVATSEVEVSCGATESRPLFAREFVCAEADISLEVGYRPSATFC